jgi:WD40 repeat protein
MSRSKTAAGRRLALLVSVAFAAGMNVASLPVAGSGAAWAEAIEAAAIQHEGPVDFQKELLPILRKKCLACHNATDAESGLVLESPATILKGGNEGPSAVPGKPDESLVYLLAAHRQEPVMPPEANSANAENFTPEEVALLRLWIEQGATGEVTAADTKIAWQTLPPGVNPVLAAAYSGDGQYLVAGRANQIVVYDVALQRKVAQLIDPSLDEQSATKGMSAAHLDLVQSLAFSPDRQWIASGEYRTVKLWQRASDLIANWKVDGLASGGVAVVGERLYTGQQDGSVRVDDLSGATQQMIAAPEAAGGTPAAVTSLAVSPGQAWAASVRGGQEIRLDGPASGKRSAIAAAAPVRALAWLDDTHLVAGCEDNQLYLWQVDAEGKAAEPRVCAGHQQPVTSIAALPGGRWISGSADGTLRVWEAATGNNTHTLQQGAPLSFVAASVDGKRAVAGSPAAKAKLWDLEKAAVVVELNGQSDLSWQRDRMTLQQQVAQRHADNANTDLEEAKKRVTAEEESLKKVTENRDKTKTDLEAKTKAATDAVAASEPAQKALAEAQAALEQAKAAQAAAADEAAKQAAQSAVDQAQAKVAEVEKDAKAKAEAAANTEKERAAAMQAAESAVRAVEVSEKTLADARVQVEQMQPLLTAAQEQLAKQQATTKEVEDRYNGFQHLPVRGAVSASGRVLATIDEQGDVLLASGEDGRSLRSLATRVASPAAIAFVGDESLLVTAADGQVNRWRLDAHWQLARTIGSPDDKSPLADRVTALAFSPDGTLLALGGGQPSRGGELKIYRVADGELVKEIADAHSDSVFGVAFSPNGQQLASCGADRFMKVFDVANGSLVRTFEGHTHHVLGVSWRADGRVLATAGADKVVKLWNFADGAQIRTISGFGKEVTSLEFAGASDALFAACGDQSLYRCDMAGDRKPLASGKDFLYVVRTNLLGKQVAFGGHDSVVRLVEEGGKSLAELNP